MTLRPWLNAEGRPIMINGKICLSETCPCEEGECLPRLEAREAELKLDPLYRFIQSVSTDYRCPESDSGSGSSDGAESDSSSSGSAGSLAVLMARNETWSSPYVYAVHASEFEVIATGERLVIACACSCGGDWSYLELPGYGIAGTAEASPLLPCEPADMCSVYELEIDYFASWHGGEVFGEGFWDYVSDGDYNYTIFRKAIVYDTESSDSGAPTTSRIAWIECQCTGRASSMVKGGSIAVHRASGICSSPCPDLFALRETALDEGWTWHDAGFILNEVYSRTPDGEGGYAYTWHGYYDPPVFVDYLMACQGCADDGQRLHFIPCDCSGIIVKSKSDLSDWNGELETHQDFAIYLPVDEACRCSYLNSRRELWMTYPEIFGVDSIAWGSDQLVQYTGYIMEDPYTATSSMQDLMGSYDHTCGSSHVVVPGSNYYIDYRTMCVIRKHYGGWLLAMLSPRGSVFSEYAEQTGYDVMPTFIGRLRAPFGSDPLVYGERRGYQDGWTGPTCLGEMGEERRRCGYETEADATADYDAYQAALQPPTPSEILLSDAPPIHACVTEPQTSYTRQAGRGVWGREECWETPDEEEICEIVEWCWEGDRYCYPGGFTWYWNTSPWRQIIYFYNWIDTNAGLLLNGLGMVDSFDYRHLDGTPDEHIVPCVLDTDMHWCWTDFVPPWEDSDSSSSGGGGPQPPAPWDPSDSSGSSV